MAVALDPKEVLRSTDGKENFQRLTRLLISGGASLFREIFDVYCPPSKLPSILNMPTTKSHLDAAKLTKPQRDCLYPSPGVYGKSTDFDVTLLFRLLRSICGLTPPTTGWDTLPASTDHSLTADLVRIKCYRNSIYGHKQDMEISNEEFVRLWQEVSEALVRLAKSISTDNETLWIEAINFILRDALTEKDNRNVQELERWYKNDMDVKTYFQELKLGMDRLEKTVKAVTPHPIHEEVLQEIKEISKWLKDLRKVPEERGRQFSTKVRFPRDKSRSLSHCSQLTGGR